MRSLNRKSGSIAFWTYFTIRQIKHINAAECLQFFFTSNKKVYEIVLSVKSNEAGTNIIVFEYKKIVKDIIFFI